MNTQNTTAAPTVPSREQFIATIAKRAGNGDAAALATLTSERAQSLAFSALLTSICQKQKTTLATLVSALSDDDVTWLKKTLPKDSPQHAALTAALKEARRNAAPVVTVFQAGERSFKDGSTNANAQLRVNVSGVTRFSEVHESAWWSCLLTVIDHPATLEAIRQFVSDNPPAVK